MSQVDLPFVSSSADAARELLAVAARDLGAVGDALHDVQIVVHELVTNAIDHGVPDEANTFTLTWWLEEGLLCIGVRDRGTAGVIAVQAFDTSSDRGRGLALIDAISVRWSAHRHAGTVVFAWVRLTADATDAGDDPQLSGSSAPGVHSRGAS